MQSQSDDIDIMLTLHPHGWSTCLIFVQGKVYELIITHVFGDPYYDFIHALELLLIGQNNVSFFWYSEPGGNRIEIVRVSSEKHKVLIRIQGFSENFGDEIKSLEELVSFEININSFLIIAYLQLKKIFLLLKDRNFAKERNNIFPFTKFLEFEKHVLKQSIL